MNKNPKRLGKLGAGEAMQYELTEQEAELVDSFRALRPSIRYTLYNFATSLRWVQETWDASPMNPGMQSWLDLFEEGTDLEGAESQTFGKVNEQ